MATVHDDWKSAAPRHAGASCAPAPSGANGQHPRPTHAVPARAESEGALAGPPRRLLAGPRGAAFWLVVRVVLGLAWIEAALPKFTDPAWLQTGEPVRQYLANAVRVANPPRPRIVLDVLAFDWYNQLFRGLIDSGAYVWLAKLIAVGELLVGGALVAGALVGPAACVSLFLSWNLGMSGSARTNILLIVVAMLVLFARGPAGRFGVDGFALPRLGRRWQRLRPLLSAGRRSPRPGTADAGGPPREAPGHRADGLSVRATAPG
jgi:thiosulfate dehydrogenase [quinone] large subunit